MIALREITGSAIRTVAATSFLAGTCPPVPSRRDPKDSYLLALAEASQAEFLVTGDKELLSLKQHKSIRIITPAAMIEILKKAESGRAPDSGRALSMKLLPACTRRQLA